MLKINQLQINFYTFIKNILQIYIFVQAQAQKYGKIFLIFREINAKMEQKKERANKNIPYYALLSALIIF